MFTYRLGSAILRLLGGRFGKLNCRDAERLQRNFDGLNMVWDGGSGPTLKDGGVDPPLQKPHGAQPATAGAPTVARHRSGGLLPSAP